MLFSKEIHLVSKKSLAIRLENIWSETKVSVSVSNEISGLVTQCSTQISHLLLLCLMFNNSMPKIVIIAIVVSMAIMAIMVLQCCMHLREGSCDSCRLATGILALIA